MQNDARWIAAATQQYLLEYETESVVLCYDPQTGAVGGPLSPFVKRIAKGYTQVPERLTKTGTFRLAQPAVGVRIFNADGQDMTPETVAP